MLLIVPRLSVGGKRQDIYWYIWEVYKLLEGEGNIFLGKVGRDFLCNTLILKFERNFKKTSQTALQEKWKLEVTL